jgi:hypothetical protein
MKMKVEEDWWEDYSGTAFWPGQIVAVSFDDEMGRFFILQLDGEERTYPMTMRYDAVLLYADEEDANFYKRHLPDSLPEDPEGEEITLAQLLRHKKGKHRTHLLT